ncbi:phosphoribosyltransferase family protein [Sedimentitalea sp. JM2-8]|uniref:Phosphoribosyltransferase family protein n=1 Tax=Sedimentitalea xiamensis TaxID=3050037 RepID=A0ABT7FEE3_9RHOB|nr:phosphoribosyltransferase family protein [Sedimentitalea xiamensis]MDK3073492.1 phosphoribosyltransferase family protein [Sedimentitalea xiamensis]
MDDSLFQFADRADAGRRLAQELADLCLDAPVVYALPRGGVPVAAEVAARLSAPLDLVLVRKLGAPGNPEVALGAVVEGSPPHLVLNEDVRRMSGADERFVETARRRELREMARRRAAYVGDRPRLDPAGRTAIVVDDGLATGATMKAALGALRRQGAARIVVALPVAPESSLKEIAELADDVLCLHPARQFFGVGAFYRDFRQLTDAQTVAALRDIWTMRDRQ